MVDAVDDIERLLSGDLTLYRAGHHHTLKTHLIEIAVESLRRFDLYAGFEHHLHPSIASRHSGWIVFTGPGELGSFNAESISAAGDPPIPATMDGIELQQVGGHCSISTGIIDMHQFDARPLP